MNALATLVMVAALGQTPVDPAELAKAQKALESYLSRIEAIQIAYNDTSTIPRQASEASDPLAPPRRSSPTARTVMDEYDLLYAYPSLSVKVVERRNHVDGKSAEHKRETRIHKGKHVSIDYTHRHFNTITSADPNPFPSLPLNSLGLRVHHTLATPLSDFLKFPDITYQEDEQKIDGERAIVLKIGPQIPESIRPNGWSADATMRVWLAPDYSYLPLRMEIMRRPATNLEEKIRLSAGKFQPVPDAARGTTLPFPHELEIEWPNGLRSTFSVQSAVVNPRVSDQDFVLTPPPGYSVAINGIPQVLSGGPTHRDDRVRQSVEDARRLLRSVDPPRSSSYGSIALPLGAGILTAFVLVILVFYKWRKA